MHVKLRPNIKKIVVFLGTDGLKIKNHDLYL